MADTELILQAQGGDGQAFGLLARRYGGRVYRTAYALLRNAEDAADVSQEVFLRAFRALRTFDPARPLYPWLYRILKNLCINLRVRSGSRTVAAESMDWVSDERMGPETAAIRAAEIRTLHAAMDRLPAAHREIIELKHFGQASYAEIAEILSIPMGTVMSRLYNSRKRLRETIEQIEGEQR